jgi:uncharacterized protein (UPF0303 family)
VRTLVVERHPNKAVCISIIHASTDKPMFFARTKGVTASQFAKLEGMRKAVKYLEMSTCRASHPFGGNTESLGPDYDLTPGGWPIRVKGVEGIVAVLLVGGLGPKRKGDEVDITWASNSSTGFVASLDHELILDALSFFIDDQ